MNSQINNFSKNQIAVSLGNVLLYRFQKEQEIIAANKREVSAEEQERISKLKTISLRIADNQLITVDAAVALVKDLLIQSYKKLNQNFIELFYEFKGLLHNGEDLSYTDFLENLLSENNQFISFCYLSKEKEIKEIIQTELSVINNGNKEQTEAIDDVTTNQDQEKLNQAGQKIDELNSANTKLQEELKNQKEAFNSSQETLKQKDEEIEKLKQQFAQLKEKKEQEIQEVVTQKEELQQEIESLKKQKEDEPKKDNIGSASEENDPNEYQNLENVQKPDTTDTNMQNGGEPEEAEDEDEDNKEV